MCYDELAIDALGEALLEAISAGNLEDVKKLIAQGASINHRGEATTALHCASGRGDLDIVKFLIENGADVNYTNGYRATPLINASRYGHVDVIKYLVINGADLEQIDDSDNTPLKAAVYWARSPGAVKLLIELGANVPSDIEDHLYSKEFIVGNVMAFLKNQ